MTHREDFLSKENSLINRSKRELVNGRDKDAIEKLRLMCFSRGATGILGLGRAFRNMERDGTTALDLENFKTNIRKVGLDCTDQDIRDMFARFDEKGTGSVTTDEFLSKLRPSMPQSRLDIIDKAFNKVNNSADNVIAIKDLRKVYSVRNQPRYLSGDMTEDEILTKFLNNFDGGHQDGQVTKEDFLNYYSTISASIDNDAYFDLMMRRDYKL